MSTTLPTVLPQAVDIHPGEHPTATWHGLTFNLDTIWVTAVAGVILILLGFLLRHQLTKQTDDHVRLSGWRSPSGTRPRRSSR